MKCKKSEISLWFRYVLFFLYKVSADFCHLNTDSRHIHSFLRAAEFGFTVQSCSPPAFPACRAENTTFLPGALLTTGLAEQVENYYPALSCQCPNRCRLFQASLSKWIPSGLADQLWRSGILAQQQMLFFLAGHGAQARDCSKGENMPPAVAGPLQRAVNSPTHSAAARHTDSVAGAAGPRAGAARLCLQSTSPIAHMHGC